MKKNLFIVLITILSITNFVFAADWVQIYEKIYLDASSLNPYRYTYSYKDDALYSIWVKSLNDGEENWKNIEKDMGKKLWYEKELVILNCTKKEIATKSIVYYDLKENVVYNNDYIALHWMSVVPETRGEGLYVTVCSAVDPNISNTTNTTISDKNNIITTPDGTNVRIKYHKKRAPLFNK